MFRVGSVIVSSLLAGFCCATDDLGLVFSDGAEGMSFHRFTGERLDAPSNLASYGNYWYPAPGDFDGDGDDDLLVQRNFFGDVVYVEMEDGRPISRQVFSWLPGWSLFTADFDGDGKDDLLVVGPVFDAGEGRYVRHAGIWFMDGPQRRAWASLGLIGGSIEPADFNVDGKADLLFNGFDGHVIGYTMNGATRLDRRVLGYQPDRRVEPRDLDGDGDDDLLIYDNNADQLQIVELQGLDRVGARAVGRFPDYAWFDSGDFDGDGDLDLLMRHKSTHIVQIVLLEAGRVVGNGTPGQLPRSTLAADLSVLVTDCDGDGIDDVIVIDGESLVAKTWLIDGPGLKRSVFNGFVAEGTGGQARLLRR